MILPLLYSLKNLSIGKPLKYLSVFILLAFTVQVYHTSYLKSENYVASYAHKAAYAAAQWLNLARLKEKATVLSYTNNIMVDYYLENKRHQPQKITTGPLYRSHAQYPGEPGPIYKNIF